MGTTVMAAKRSAERSMFRASIHRCMACLVAVVAVAIVDASVVNATTRTPFAISTRTPTCTPGACAPRTCPPDQSIVCAQCGCDCDCAPRFSATPTPTCTPQAIHTCRPDQTFECSGDPGCLHCTCIAKDTPTTTPTCPPPPAAPTCPPDTTYKCHDECRVDCFCATKTSTPTRTATDTAIAARCAGDCDGDGRVTVDELIRGVTIALGLTAADACPQYDCSSRGCVAIEVVIRAVRNALYGCSVTTALERVVAHQCRWNCPALFIQDVSASEQGYVVDCNCIAGHASDVELVRYANSADAAAAFLAATSERAPIAFHDLPAAYWEIPSTVTHYGGADRYLVWQLGCWVITAHSFDDTDFRIAAQPAPFSEAILAESGDLLLAECVTSM